LSLEEADEGLEAALGALGADVGPAPVAHNRRLHQRESECEKNSRIFTRTPGPEYGPHCLRCAEFARHRSEGLLLLLLLLRLLLL